MLLLGFGHLFYHSHPLCLLKESINLHIEAATFDREVKNHSLALSLKTRREKKKKTSREGGFGTLLPAVCQRNVALAVSGCLQHYGLFSLC